MNSANRAAQFALNGNIEEAVAHLRRAIEENPNDHASHSYLLLCLHYRTASASELFSEHLKWSKQHALPPSATPSREDESTERRVRVGYVSPNFREWHPTNYFIEPVLRSHDHEKFTIYCYSDAVEPDPVATRFRGLCDRWLNTGRLSSSELSDQIRSDRIDVAVDLAGHCAGNRLVCFSERVAPVQVTWLGYPNTTGLSSMDYRLVDEISDPYPFSDQYCTEKLVRMEEGFFCYQPPRESVPVSALPAWFAGNVTFGSFQYPGKLSSEVIEDWAQILNEIPNSRLILQHCFSDFGDKSGPVLRKIRSRFAEYGVRESQLIFIGPIPTVREHLQLYGRVDIALDPFPYSGTTTTCEALWMGVPVISRGGKTHASRVSKSILSHMGMEELATDTRHEYVQTALKAARDLRRLAEVRASLRHEMLHSPILDAKRFTEKLEEKYRWMCRIARDQSDPSKQSGRSV